MESTEREALVRELVSELEVRGVPQGTWLVDIAFARDALHMADDLLRRLQQAAQRHGVRPVS